MFKKKIFLIFLKALPAFLLLGLFIFKSISGFAQTEPSDAIAIRVIPNPNHYGISYWYATSFKTGGSPQLLTVDGYEAIRDGRSVYVNVANVSSSNQLHTNIYLISFNQEAENATVDIFSKMLSRWKFNTNKSINGLCRKNTTLSCLNDEDCPINDFCSSDKARITRDTKRLADLAEIKILLNEYQTKNSAYPLITAGSYIPNASISVWPSWQKAFSEKLKTKLPVDPVNKIGPCAAGYSPDTCWDENDLRFSSNLPDLPDNSLVYTYVASANGATVNLCAVFESGLTIPNLSTIGSCANICLDFDDDGYGSPGSAICRSGSALKDCNDVDPLVTTGSPENCSNGSDDDCDGFIDCEDTLDCSSYAICIGLAVCNADNYCDVGETCAGCPFDHCCDCGNGICESLSGECNTCYGAGRDCSCGDTIFCSAYEECDDGDLVSGDGCDTTCRIEPMTCFDNDGDGFSGRTAACLSGNDCDDDPLACGNRCYPGRMEVCDDYDNNCDNTIDNGIGMNEETCVFVCHGLNITYDFNITRGGTLACCGDDAPEGPFQDPETACTDLRDNNCNSLVDGADSDCSGVCTDLTEDSITNFLTPGICDQCGDGDALPDEDNDGDQTAGGENWAPYWHMVDACDSDCGIVLTTVQFSNYQHGSETCDGIDNDCDRLIDEGVTVTYYRDGDNDGYGGNTIFQNACSAPAGYVLSSNDCNDASGAIHPGVTEICDGIDNDCNGSTDEGVTVTYYRDGDNDNYGVNTVFQNACSAPTGYVSSAGDCNDANGAIHPGVTETCGNLIDDDCDGDTDELCAVCYPDGDHDTYGDRSAAGINMGTCDADHSLDNTDCDDTRNWVYPGATENCDTYDNDCDTLPDDGCDDDSDRYCDQTMHMYNSNIMCTLTTIYTFPADNGSLGNDCNDGSDVIYPGAPEICGDGIMQDCNRSSDLSCLGICTDTDGDRQIAQGTAVNLCGPVCGTGTQTCLSNNDCDDSDDANYHGNTEICDDNQDNDCDTLEDCDDSPPCPVCPNLCIFNPSFPFTCEFTL